MAQPQLIHNPPSAIPRTAILKGMDEIVPGLFLGDILSTYNVDLLQETGVKNVISLVDRPLPQWLRARYSNPEVGIKHTEFFVHDDEIEDIITVMAQACDLVQESLVMEKEGVLVHCGLGVSRSGSVVIGYLMRRDKIDRDEALALVKQKRPRVCPNSGFWEQLKIWEVCQFQVWDEIEGKKVKKEIYREWKETAEGKLRDRIAAGSGAWRDAGLNKVLLKKTARNSSERGDVEE